MIFSSGINFNISKPLTFILSVPILPPIFWPFSTLDGVDAIPIEPGDTLYLSSDGFVDQLGGEHNYSLGWTKFTKILGKMEGIPLEEQKKLILQELEKYQNGTPQIDDITMIGFKII